MRGGMRFRTRERTRRLKECVAGVLIATASTACGQAQGPASKRASEFVPETHMNSGFTVLGSAPILREIRDPHTGSRWMIVANKNHPGGPGQMFVATAATDARSTAEEETKTVIIHPGDRLVVEEHTFHSDARLEAVALSAAQVGSRFDVRLQIGRKVVRVMALGPGRAAFLERGESKP